MNKLSRSTVHESLPTEWKAGAQLLVNAYEAAKAHQIPIEQYAVSHEELSSSGLSGTAIRQMIQEDLLRSFQETTTPESSQRTFDESANLGFFPRQCFCLSESGLHC